MDKNELQRKASTAADLRTFMLDSVSAALPAAGALLAIRNQT